MSESIEHVKEWSESIRDDVEVVKAVVDAEGVARRARTYAAAALNYLITRMDLVPDWNETIGVMDDVMIVRVCMDLAHTYEVEKGLDAETLEKVTRLINDVVKVEDFLGEDLYAKLRKHCSRLSETAVRERSPQAIVDDKDLRQALYKEVDEQLLRIPAATFPDPDAIAVNFKSYLHHKLD